MTARPLSVLRSLALALTVLLAGAAGCAAPGTAGIAPRFPDDVAAAIARDPMRRMETENLIVYYPAFRRAEAVRAAGQIERCARILETRTFVHNGLAHRKMVIVMPEVPFNNAFVEPPAPALEPVSVVPTMFTFDFQSQAGMPPDPSSIGCHEITHYVHGVQIRGLPWLISIIFGNTLTPQGGLEGWFWEGLATYYETALQPGRGRLAWPLWNGVFHAGVAGRRLSGGDLSELNRDYPQGGHYLVGAHFIAFLVDRYGEAALWSAIYEQAGAVFSPFGISGRFERTFGHTLSELIDAFADDVSQRYPVRARPPTQAIVHDDAGRDARYARGRNGTEALLASHRDRPPTLQVFDPKGRLLARVNLTDVLPPRRLAEVAVANTSGLAVSDDGANVFFTSLDIGATFNVAKLVRYDVRAGALSVVVDDLGGAGGTLLPDGRRYLFARAEGDTRHLATVDIATGTVTPLASLPPRTFVGTPRVSPDGRRIAAGLFKDGQPRLGLFDGVTGALVGELDTKGAVDDASFVDDHRLVFLGTVGGRFQVFEANLDTQTLRPLTDAPYVAANPWVVGGKLRFLNREGLGYTVDEVALADASAPSPTAVAADVPRVAPEAPAVAPDLPVPAPPLPPEAVAVLSDEPASSAERVLVPQGFGLSTAAVSDGPILTELTVAGGDRLNQHRWLLSGAVQSTSRDVSLAAAYANRQLAPFTIVAQAQHEAWQVRAANDPSDAPLSFARRQDAATLALARAFWGNPVLLGGSWLRDRTEALDGGTVPLGPRRERQLAGPTLSATFAGLEATPVSGVRRLAEGDIDATFFPEAWNTAGTTFADLRAAGTAVLPLAPLRGPTFLLAGRARWLAGTSAPWLQLGGASSSVVLGSSRDVPGVQDIDALPPGVHFFESVRGFEDLGFFANRIAIGDAALRFPFVIDRGWASSLGFLPSLFVRQVNLGFFGTVASDGRPPGESGVHAATGGNLDLALALWRLPFRLRYQLARRLTDDRAWTHLIALDLGV